MDKVSHAKSRYAKSLGYYISNGEFGIKALRDKCFALLYVPHGAIVHVEGVSDDRFDDGVKQTMKHRASKAYVIAVCKVESTRREFVKEQKKYLTDGENFEIELKKDVIEGLSIRNVSEGRSIKYSKLKYVTDSWMSIDDYAICGDVDCGAGIHYYPGWKSAMEYHIYNIYGFYATLQDPDTCSKCIVTENLLPMILPSWMEYEICKFKRIHDDIYKCSYDEEGRILFEKINSLSTISLLNRR